MCCLEGMGGDISGERGGRGKGRKGVCRDMRKGRQVQVRETTSGMEGNTNG